MMDQLQELSKLLSAELMGNCMLLQDTVLISNLLNRKIQIVIVLKKLSSSKINCIALIMDVLLILNREQSSMDPLWKIYLGSMLRRRMERSSSSILPKYPPVCNLNISLGILTILEKLLSWVGTIMLLWELSKD